MQRKWNLEEGVGNESSKQQRFVPDSLCILVRGLFQSLKPASYESVVLILTSLREVDCVTR